MKKYIQAVFFITIIILLLTNYLDIISSIKLSFNICIKNLFPSLIPFMLLSNIFINYNFIYEISNSFNKLTNKLFKLNSSIFYVIIMSMLSGTPSNAKYLSDLYKKNYININDIKKTILFCHFTNPFFILGTIGYIYLNNKKIGLIILISHYLSSFIIALIVKKKYSLEKIDILNEKNNNKNFLKIFNESIFSTFNTLILILGVITTCLILTTVINNYINIDNNFKFIYGLIEITQGLNYLSLSNLNIYIKSIIATFLISFGGLCIHIQVFSILDNKKIRYIPYLISRIFHGILSSIITIIFLYWFSIY